VRRGGAEKLTYYNNIYLHVPYKPNVDDNDDSTDMMNDGRDVDEDKLFAEESEFERKFVIKYRSLFREKLGPSKYFD